MKNLAYFAAVACISAFAFGCSPAAPAPAGGATTEVTAEVTGEITKEVTAEATAVITSEEAK